MIKAIGFDYGGVIEIPKKKHKTLFETLDIEPKIFSEEWNKVNHLVNVDGAITYFELLEIICKRLQIDPKKLKKVEKMEKDKILNKDLMKLIKKIRTKGYKTFIISNHDKSFLEKIKKQKIDKLFDEIIISSEVKAQKPDKEIFLEASKRLKVKPKDFIFIDDNVRPLSKSEEIGFIPIQYKNMSVKDLEKKLTELIEL